MNQPVRESAAASRARDCSDYEGASAEPTRSPRFSATRARTGVDTRSTTRKAQPARITGSSIDPSDPGQSG